jgi:hypothetical protein
VHVTVVEPIGNVAPDGGLQVAVTGPSTASEADAENDTTAPAALVAAALMFPGTLTVGG